MHTHTDICSAAAVASHRPRAWATIAVLAGLLIGPATLSAQSTVKTSDVPATAAEANLRLVDQSLPLSERRAAAMSLLNLDNRESRRVLASALNEGVNPTAWRAVAEAVAIHPYEPPDDLWEPMANLVLKAEGPIQAALAEALGRYDKEELIQKLFRVAGDQNAAIPMRRGAIAALGHQRTQKVTEFLINLTQINQPDAVQEAAFLALATLTGLDDYGHDRAAWLDWWGSARRWSHERWQERLLANLARRDVERRSQQQAIVDRLIESQRALYRTTASEDRPAVLAYMLGDALPAIRQLGVELSLQRLVDDRAFDEPLRQALRGRISDPEPDIRRRATLLLRDLADAPAADRVADRLARNEEQVVSVLRAYLLMMSRLPRPQAVEAQMQLLEEPTLIGEAAGALAASADAGLLDRKQAGNIVKRLRKLLETRPTPPAQVATLLGKVGDEEDWARIAQWIDSPDPSLKRAAAAAWAESSRSLQILADRMSDPIIEPIVIAAAIRQGDDPWTLRALAQHRPTQPQSAEAWEQALVAMARRVQPPVALETVQRLEVQGQSMGLLDRMLSAALSGGDGTAADAEAPGDLAPLRLKRAEIRLAAGNPAAALEDYNVVYRNQQNAAPPRRLSPEARARMNRGRVQAYLQVGQPDEAFSVARELIPADQGAHVSTDDPIVDQFVEAARHYAQAGQGRQARQVIERLRGLLGPMVKPEVAQRIALVEAEINSRAPGETATARRENGQPAAAPPTAADPD